MGKKIILMNPISHCSSWTLDIRETSEREREREAKNTAPLLVNIHQIYLTSLCEKRAWSRNECPEDWGVQSVAHLEWEMYLQSLGRVWWCSWSRGRSLSQSPEMGRSPQTDPHRLPHKLWPHPDDPRLSTTWHTPKTNIQNKQLTTSVTVNIGTVFKSKIN